jgi:cob(I)alamin adenosyltransferase
VHVLTGDGKGKTTAAIGLAIRAAGAGLTVFMGQFIKKGIYSEIKALKRFDDLITVEQFGRGRFIRNDPEPEDLQAAQRGLDRLHHIVGDDTHDVVILDEANVAVRLGLVTIEQLLDLIAARPRGMEMVVTGRYAHSRLVETADLVTEMSAVKHYFTQGVTAREGIEK